jgi:hypothetical protein
MLWHGLPTIGLYTILATAGFRLLYLSPVHRAVRVAVLGPPFRAGTTSAAKIRPPFTGVLDVRL